MDIALEEILELFIGGFTFGLGFICSIFIVDGILSAIKVRQKHNKERIIKGEQ